MFSQNSQRIIRCTSGRYSKIWNLQSQEAFSKQYSTTLDEKDYLHRSVLSTHHFQKSLPRLPVPKLETTCERYLKSQLPLLTDDEYKKTETLVNQFRDDLQAELVAQNKRNKHTSYITEPWFEMYLRNRDSICLNQNPFIVFNPDPKPEYNNQTLRANILDPEMFHMNPKKTDNNSFRRKMKWCPELFSAYAAIAFKVFPLDMSQYGRLFNSTRIPRDERDELFTDETARHVVVIRNGNFYAFDVLDANGNVRSAGEILACLQHVQQVATTPAAVPLAVMTAEHRDTWTDCRKQLIAAGNEDKLRLVDSAVFVLGLDDFESDDHVTNSRNFLNGDGFNRWFDKSFNLIVTANGMSCVNFEHAWGDGVAVLRYFNEIFKDSTEKPNVHPDTRPATLDLAAEVKSIDFQYTDQLKQLIGDAKQKFDSRMKTLDLQFLQDFGYGKNYLKKNQLSPDSFLQLSFQLAFYRHYGYTAATYESCSTAAFKHGRTETIRPATTATKTCCEMFERAGTRPSASELRAAIDECSKVHGELTKNAAMGQGWDRHLFALKYNCTQAGRELPDLYHDPNYAKINHIILSTSTLSSPAVLIGGFAAVTQDGYGIGYAAENDWLGCNVTCYPPNRDVNSFLDCVQSSWKDMQTVIEGNDFK